MTDRREPVPPSRPRPAHLQWSLIGLVAFGGAVGTGIRALLASIVPDVDGLSWIIFGINVFGALLLGLLLEALTRRGSDTGRRRQARLLLGTGVLGGFTTYSTLASDTAHLLIGGRVGAGTGYALATVVAGLIAVLLGVIVARAVPRRTDGDDAAASTASRPIDPDTEDLA